MPTILSRTCEKFRLFMEGVVALFDSMRDTDAPARWVYQQNKNTFEIVPRIKKRPLWRRDSMYKQGFSSCYFRFL